MRDKLLRNLSAWVRPEDRVTVALSGGQDSMCLLHCTAALAPRLGITLSAAHFHHGIRGEEADRDEQFLRDYCADAGIPLAVGHGDAVTYAKIHRVGLEQAARTLRYAYLESLDTDFLLTAHNAEDNLETFLLHLLRGTGLHGLTGIPPRRGKVLRPMLDVTRQEISSYLAAYGVPHVEDSTNVLNDNVRNRIRHQVLPLLTAENPSLPLSVFALTQSLRQEDGYLDAQAGAFLAAQPEPDVLSCQALLALHPALSPRVMGLFLREVPETGRVHIQAAMTLCLSEVPSGELDLPGGWRLRREYGCVRRIPPELTVPEPEPVEISPGQRVSFGTYIIECEQGPRPERLPGGTVALSTPALTGPLLLRPRKPGDRIRLPGGTKKLGRLMIDRKIPAAKRDLLPVVEVCGTVAAVLPDIVSAEFRAGIGEDSLLLTLKEERRKNNA